MARKPKAQSTTPGTVVTQDGNAVTTPAKAPTSTPKARAIDPAKAVALAKVGTAVILDRIDHDPATVDALAAKASGRYAAIREADSIIAGAKASKADSILAAGRYAVAAKAAGLNYRETGAVIGCSEGYAYTFLAVGLGLAVEGLAADGTDDKRATVVASDLYSAAAKAHETNGYGKPMVLAAASSPNPVGSLAATQGSIDRATAPKAPGKRGPGKAPKALADGVRSAIVAAKVTTLPERLSASAAILATDLATAAKGDRTTGDCALIMDHALTMIASLAAGGFAEAVEAMAAISAPAKAEPEPVA